MCESMVERVARAIYETDDPWHTAFPWPNLNTNQGGAEGYRRAARAAIEAMLQPTDAMIDMMYDADNDGEVEHAYRSAIRAALNEQVAG